MKSTYIFGLGATIILIVIGLLILTFDTLDPFAFKYSANDMLEETRKQTHLLSPQEFIDLQKAETVAVIDLRDPESFAIYNLEGAVNIPLERILDASFIENLRHDGKKVLIDTDGFQANQAWVLITQFGNSEVYVLEGGIQNWRAHVDVESLAKSTAFEDEKPRHDFSAISK